MKFLLDANLPYSAKAVFGSEHEAIHVQDVDLATAADIAILNWARKQKAILITRDLDFANILRVPPKSHFGILVLRLHSSYSAKEIKRVLGGFLSKTDSQSFPRSLIIVEEGRYRVRR